VNPVETKFRGRVITVTVEQVLLPSGATATYEIVHHPGGAAIVAVNNRQEVCLLRQYRPAAGGWVWELPAGRLEPNEAPMRTAQRELREETGCSAQHWQELGGILSSPGVFDETIHLFLAQNLAIASPQHEAFEVIEVHWLGLPEAARRALAGDYRDAKTVIGLLRAQARLLQN
jgi:8-oxo-dGTP pyrophosphatase MutT (NUDIX family)